MAKIIKSNEQEEALKCVSKYLRELKKIKEFNDASKMDYKIRIKAKSNDNSVMQISYDISENIANATINNYRKAIVKNIVKLTNDYGIGLEMEEKALLED